MVTVEQVRKILGKDFSHLTDEEIEQIRDDMFNFWKVMLED